ncbi:hypothetical protein CRG98_002092 [Punica granatum]|uniref:Uncharacterized protein n=1 Tax=Punica granatum TaxID=22663 RepID=A0A2I0LBC6_PUNGR|nr:hypothetical protein CRG98_002092 [Punica granatum]
MNKIAELRPSDGEIQEATNQMTVLARIKNGIATVVRQLVLLLHREINSSLGFDGRTIGLTDQASITHSSVGPSAVEMGHPSKSYPGLRNEKTRLHLLSVSSAESRKKRTSCSRPVESFQQRIPSNFSGRNLDINAADSKWPDNDHFDCSNSRTSGLEVCFLLC